jgi:hypothetical protein
MIPTGAAGRAFAILWQDTGLNNTLNKFWGYASVPAALAGDILTRVGHVNVTGLTFRKVPARLPVLVTVKVSMIVAAGGWRGRSDHQFSHLSQFRKKRLSGGGGSVGTVLVCY